MAPAETLETPWHNIDLEEQEVPQHKMARSIFLCSLDRLWDLLSNDSFWRSSRSKFQLIDLRQHLSAARLPNNRHSNAFGSTNVWISCIASWLPFQKATKSLWATKKWMPKLPLSHAILHYAPVPHAKLPSHFPLPTHKVMSHSQWVPLLDCPTWWLYCNWLPTQSCLQNSVCVADMCFLDLKG